MRSLTLLIAVLALVTAGVALGFVARGGFHEGDGWLRGTVDERFDRVEAHLRGLDHAMAETSYRYHALLVASRQRNWQHAAYQIGKIDQVLQLAIQRRPHRRQSARPFLREDIPAVKEAIDARDPSRLDASLERLHQACLDCHAAEGVGYFESAVERIRRRARQEPTL